MTRLISLHQSSLAYRLLTVIILAAMLLSMTAPKPAVADTQPIATKLIITADSSVVGPDGKFTATLTTADGGAVTLNTSLYSYIVVFAVDGVTYSPCDNVPLGAVTNTAECVTFNDLAAGSHTITAKFTSTPVSNTDPLDYSGSTGSLNYAPNCKTGEVVTTASDALGDDGKPVAGSLRAVVSDPALCLGARISFDGDYTISAVQPVPPTTIVPTQIFLPLAGNYIEVLRAVTIDGSGHAVTLTGSGGVLFFYGTNATADVPVVLKNISVKNAACPSAYPIGNVVVEGYAKIENVSFSGNTCGAAGAIYNAGFLSVINSSFTGNSATARQLNEGDGGGGAIYNHENAYLTVSGSTFANNTALLDPGGAINNRSVHDTYITNSTFYGNTGYESGGAIASEQGVSTIFLTNSTIVNNTITSSAESLWVHGAGIYLGAWDSEIRNSIIAGNTGGNGNCDFQAAVTGSNNLSDDPSCVNPDYATISAGFTQKTAGEIDLGTFGDNGGGTQTIPLLAGSAAIDAGSDSVCLATDQRGVSRPQGAHCDIGSYEYEPPVTYNASGMVWNDLNGDGIKDPGETGLEGWDVRIFIGEDTGCVDAGTGTIATTDANGAYSFTGLPQLSDYPTHQYCLIVDLKDGWEQTSAYFWDRQLNPITSNPTGLDVGVNQPILSFTPAEHTMTVNAGDPIDLTITVSGGTGPYTFTHYWNGGDEGLTAAASGENSFTVSGTPTYTTEIALTAYDSTGNQRETIYRFEVVQPPMIGIFDLTSSANPSRVGQDVTFTLTGTSDYVWEPYGTLFPMGFVKFQADGTDIAGCEQVWLNIDMVAGDYGNYPATCTTSALEAGTHAITASFTPAYLNFAPTTLTLQDGQTVQETLSYTLRGTVFDDANGNGSWDGTETGLDGVNIKYDIGCDGNAVVEMAANSDGTYEISGLQPGVCVSVKAVHPYFLTSVGWKQTTPAVKFDPLSADQTGVNIGLKQYLIDYTPHFSGPPDFLPGLPDGQLNQPYNQSITLLGGVAPYTITMGGENNLPANGLLVTTDGDKGLITISGTPTAAGKYYLDYEITDANGVTGEAQGQFYIKTDATFTLNSSANPSNSGQPVTFSLSAVATVAGFMPGGPVTFKADGAVISGCDGVILGYDYDANTLIPAQCTTPALAVGTHAITAEFTSAGGPYNSAIIPLSQRVVILDNYTSAGFTAPLDLGGVLNQAKAGQMIPLKWRLLDGSGNPVTNLDPASVSLTVSAYSCSAGTTVDEIETYATGTTTLQNLGNGYYQLNWKTEKAWANTCKKLTLKIGTWTDPAGLTALFQFKK